jgi:hypothetical protein
MVESLRVDMTKERDRSSRLEVDSVPVVMLNNISILAELTLAGSCDKFERAELSLESKEIVANPSNVEIAELVLSLGL